MTREADMMMLAAGGAIKKQVDAAMLAVGKVVKERLDEAVLRQPINIRNEVAVPEVTITAPSVTVVVDMAPVAEAITVLSTVIADASLVADKRQEEFNQGIVQLLTALAERPAIQFSPVVKVPKSRVVVKVPPVAERAKRNVKITHSDGTESTIAEE